MGTSERIIDQIKRCNCASLPPCANTLRKHIKRANYVAKMWRSADEYDPTGGDSPLDYGWELGEYGLQPEWFDGSQLPDSLIQEENEAIGPQRDSANDSECEESDGAWNEDSDDDDASENLLI